MNKLICELCCEKKPLSNIFRDHLILKEHSICQKCTKQFKKIHGKVCIQCGISIEIGKLCIECVNWTQIESDSIKNTAIFDYNESMKAYFKLYKFMGGYHLADVFKTELHKKIRSFGAVQVVPIPIHESTFRQRGFNQVEGWLYRYQRLLIKPNPTLHQSQNSRLNRLKTKNPFEINQAISINKTDKILIIDDVYTTGRTLRHAYHCLKKQGYLNVESLTLARAKNKKTEI